MFKKSFSLLFAVCLATTLLLASFAKTASAHFSSIQDSDDPDQALCLPGLDSLETLNCLNAGPARVISDLEKKGLTFPAEAVAIAHPPADLFNIPFSYAKVSEDAVPLYASVEDALNGDVTEMMAAGRIKYVAYSEKVTNEKGNFYKIANGKWINGDVISKASIPHYQGYLIKKFSSIPFGWVLQSEAVSYTEPDFNAPLTEKTYTRFDLIHFYDSKKIGDTEWVMIGPDEWMDHKFLGIVFNKPAPPEGVTNGRWIEVNLYEQVLTVYDGGKMIFATLISTGVDPFFTQPGTFQIYKKIEHEYMTGAFEADKSDYYYLEEVPFILYFDQARALHGAYWNTFYGYQRSHGCVNLSVADAHWLYNWANQGDTVYVWDPSGKTPTDPSLYGAGGF